MFSSRTAAAVEHVYIYQHKTRCLFSKRTSRKRLHPSIKIRLMHGDITRGWKLVGWMGTRCNSIISRKMDAIYNTWNCCVAAAAAAAAAVAERALTQQTDSKRLYPIRSNGQTASAGACRAWCRNACQCCAIPHFLEGSRTRTKRAVRAAAVLL